MGECDRLAIAMLYDELINKDELLLLNQEYEETAPVFPYWKYDRFSLSILQDECLREFRYLKADIPVLAKALRIPRKFVCPIGTISSGIEGFTSASLSPEEENL